MALINDILNNNIETRGIQDARVLAQQLGNAYDAELIAKYNKLQYALATSQLNVYTPAQIAASRQLNMTPGKRISYIGSDMQRAAVINFLTAKSNSARGYRDIMTRRADNMRQQMRRIRDDLYSAGQITKAEKMIITAIFRHANSQQITKMISAYGGLVSTFAMQSDEYFETISGRFIAAIKQNQKLFAKILGSLQPGKKGITKADINKILDILTKPSHVNAEKSVLKDKTNTFLERNMSAQEAANAYVYTRGF